MSHSCSRLSARRLAGFAAIVLVVPFVVHAGPKTRSAAPPPEEKKKPASEDDEVVVLSPFVVDSVGPGYHVSNTLAGTRLNTSLADVGSSVTLGATPGGAQDIRFFRDVIAQGVFPHPDTITAEGLFSEHDLPLRNTSSSRDRLILTGEAVSTSLLGRPEARFLAQIGFASGLDAATWHRDPVNLVAVVDKSGSMSGPPLELVKRSLEQVVRPLGADDQLSIVLYGDRSHVHLAPTRTTDANRAKILASIDAILSAGSTNMEEGLRVGFQVARETQKDFRGRTRVMQFTDERPNVGDTSAAGFMGLMEAASRDGIGQTTIGVGVQFGAELASKISAVRGGNLFFFPDAAEMTKTFTEEFDTMVTELVHDLDVVIRPAAGLRVAGVYGVPGEMLKWESGRNVRFSVTTIFLSRKKGAIYVAFAPEDENLPAWNQENGASLGDVTLAYRELGAAALKRSGLALNLAPAEAASPGLQRGRLLVSEYLALKDAMKAHLVENNQERAFTVLADLRDLLGTDADPALEKERETVRTLFAAVSKLAGRGEAVGAITAPPTADATDETEVQAIQLHEGALGGRPVDRGSPISNRGAPRRISRR